MRNTIVVARTAATFTAAVVVFVGGGDLSAMAADGSTPFAWPASLAPFGDGYPAAGDVCRRLGESAATSEYLDHTATLVGCPGARDSTSAQAIVQGLQGRVVGETDGVTLISVPNEGHLAGGTTSASAPAHSTGTLRCTRVAGQRMRLCRFEVTRRDDHSAVLVVYLPAGGTRAIFFGPDGSVAGIARKATDRPVHGNATIRRRATTDLISVGHERYEVRDELIEGD
jgi:hypothetical protein